ncbi:hypothetical protein HRI_000002300 [Hibiscus trionum]|uniref:Endonuclease/exonuclease/phosphatase domain-containing protein n=1 Tax=Hibiscus trionum TaxID=183268 RepID=A0A9W7GPD7_HIBTR|nr:hypothetical protein HRI_000002300 [Hibiscus trionum]
MDLKIFCWNVQGCADRKFIQATKQFLRDNRPVIVVFVEPRISGHRAESVIAALGFPHSHRVEAAGFSGGIWVAWYDLVSVSIVITHFQFIHFRITHKASRSSFLATAIYASPSATGRKLLWHHLHHLAATIRSPWVILETLMPRFLGRTVRVVLLQHDQVRISNVLHWTIVCAIWDIADRILLGQGDLLLSV